MDPMPNSPLSYEIKREDYLCLDDTGMERSFSWDSACYPGSNSTMSSPVNSYMDSSDMYYTWNGGQGGGYSQQQPAGPSSHGYTSHSNMGESNQMGFSQPENQPRKYVCLVSGCSARAFGRSADLERHLKQVHAKESDKEKFFCDYNRCLRKDGAFGRKDHFRDHFRDYHKEDILQRGKNATQEWCESRNIKDDWWRCTKCLKRIDIAGNGFECPDCRFLCETDRQRLRGQRMQQRRR